MGYPSSFGGQGFGPSEVAARECGFGRKLPHHDDTSVSVAKVDHVAAVDQVHGNGRPTDHEIERTVDMKVHSVCAGLETHAHWCTTVPAG